MVGAAAAEYRVFQRGTQPWQRFARIQQLGFGAGEQVDIATDDAGDAGEGLHKVQRRALPVSRIRDGPSNSNSGWSALTASPSATCQVIFTSSPAS